MMNFEQFKTEYGVQLDDQQQAAVQAVDGPVLLLAVPGSGKTTVLIARLGYLIHCCGVPPEEILTMTYTVAATKEMRQRFSAKFGEELAARLEFRTINGVSAKIIRTYEQMEGRKAFELLSDETRRSAVLSELYRKTTGEFAGESQLRALKTQLTFVKNMQPAADRIEEKKLEGTSVPFAPLYRTYEKTLRANGWMDFDDQMVYALRILRRYPRVLARVQQRCRYLCVDEAQDTSRIQHEIIRLLAGRTQNLFLVGDEDQSIYAFRAAYPQALTEFENTYPSGKVLLAEQNYRSTPQITALAGRFIAQNTTRHEKHIVPHRPNGAPVLPIRVNDREAQYRQLAAIASAQERFSGVTAVLYRENDSALPLLDLLSRAGTPYRCRQLESTFFSHPVVRDVRELFAFADDPADTGLFLRLYYKFGAGISKLQAKLAADEAERAGKAPLDCLLELDSPSAWTLSKVKMLRVQLAALHTDNAERALWRIRTAIGYGEYAEKFGLDTGKLDLLEMIARQEPTPQRFLQRLSELEEIAKQGSSGEENCRFVLSTIHSSKGLEYDRVFLADVVDGILPGCDPADDTPEGRAAMEEERRLLYVGMTRAKQELAVFLFERPELHSLFGEQLFPRPKPQPTSKPARPSVPPRWESTLMKQAGERTAAVRKRSVSAAKEPPETLPAEFRPGRRVRHKIFGGGVVEAEERGVLTVRFDNSPKPRRISLSAALQVGVLESE